MSADMDRLADDEENHWRRTGQRPPLSPLVLGGQGRSPDEIREDGNGIVFLAGMLAGAVVVAAAWAVFA